MSVEARRRTLLFRLAYPFIYAFGWTLMMICGPYWAWGWWRIPRKGPVLILANHMSDVDPIAVQLGSWRMIDFMAKSELFTWPKLGTAMRWFYAFPVERGEPDRAAIKYALALLEQGRVVGVFPEGQISEHQNLLPILPGISLLARKSGCTVICCGLRNTHRVRAIGDKFIRLSLRPVTARFGTPRKFERDASPEEIVGWVESELRRLTGQ
jgi:1-acyl-sn-glycerol-3-phosphate acyltransferase